MRMHVYALFGTLALSMGCDEEDSGPSGESQSAQTDGGDTEEAGVETSDGTEQTSGPSDGSTTSTGETGSDDDGDTSGGAGVEPTFDEVFETILAPLQCANGYCHGSGAGQLQLGDAEQSYAALIDASASLAACDRTMLVVPGDPAASILYARLDPAGADAVDCFVPMPQDADPPSDSELDLVRRWIEAGAPR